MRRARDRRRAVLERFWTRSYPAGVPAQIDPARYRSIVALLEESFARFRDARAYWCMGRYLTFGELDRLSRALAAWLQELQLQRGDRVAIMLPNILQSPVAVAAVLRAGLVAVNVNPLYTPRELEHQLRDSGATAIVVLENFAAVLQQVMERTPVRHVVLCSVGDLLGGLRGALVNFVVRRIRKLVPPYALPGAVHFNDAVARGGLRALAPADLSPDSPAVLQYTGGTTGVSKGATLLHKTIIANLLASEAWLQPGLRRKRITGQIVFVCALPLYHVYAFISCSLLGMRVGGLNVLIPNPRDIEATVRVLSKFRFHVFPAVNTLFNALLNHPGFARLDFSEFLLSNGGSMPVQESVARRWLATTGCPICEGYGLSETSSGVICNPTDTDTFTGTIGLPLPTVEVRILDDCGRDVAPGEPGEIAIRGPQVMSAYWERPDETAKAITADGYFLSGDIGTMDERGYVRILDRKKDMIVVSGFKVYPTEVEAVVSGHPAVLECAAVGVPDDTSGEAVKLFVVRRDSALDARTLHEYCAERLTAYKRPRTIEFRTELPKSNVGKILRRELRDAAIDPKRGAPP
jgi:long-chain acyl-CoA synthetase